MGVMVVSKNGRGEEEEGDGGEEREDVTIAIVGQTN